MLKSVKMNPGTLWPVGWKGHQWPFCQAVPPQQTSTSDTVRTVSYVSTQKTSKCDSATCSCYDYHHHQRFNWAFLGPAVDQSWPTRWAVSPRQATDRWAITATQWHYYAAYPYQQGTGSPPWEPYSYGQDDRSHSGASDQFTQLCSPFRASSSSPISEHYVGWGQSSTSSLHIDSQAAPLSDGGFSQPSQDLQDQAFSLWDQAHGSTLNNSARPYLPSDFLSQFPVSLDPLALGRHTGMDQQQHQ